MQFRRCRETVCVSRLVGGRCPAATSRRCGCGERRARGRPAGWACGGPSLRPGSLRRGGPGPDPRPGSGRRPSGTSRRCGCGERRVEGRRGPWPGGPSFRPGFHGRARGRKPAAPRAGTLRGGRRGERTGARLRPPGGVGSPDASAPPAAGPPVAAHAGARVAPARAATRAVWPGPPRPSCRGVWTTRPRRPRCRAHVRDVSWRFPPSGRPARSWPAHRRLRLRRAPGRPSRNLRRVRGAFAWIRDRRQIDKHAACQPAGSPGAPRAHRSGADGRGRPAAASAAAGREPTAVRRLSGVPARWQRVRWGARSRARRLSADPGRWGVRVSREPRPSPPPTTLGRWGVRVSREPRPSPPPTTAGRPGRLPFSRPAFPNEPSRPGRATPAAHRDYCTMCDWAFLLPWRGLCYGFDRHQFGWQPAARDGVPRGMDRQGRVSDHPGGRRSDDERDSHEFLRAL